MSNHYFVFPRSFALERWLAKRQGAYPKASAWAKQVVTAVLAVEWFLGSLMFPAAFVLLLVLDIALIVLMFSSREESGFIGGFFLGALLFHADSDSKAAFATALSCLMKGIFRLIQELITVIILLLLEAAMLGKRAPHDLVCFLALGALVGSYLIAIPQLNIALALGVSLGVAVLSAGMASLCEQPLCLSGSHGRSAMMAAGGW